PRGPTESGSHTSPSSPTSGLPIHSGLRTASSDVRRIATVSEGIAGPSVSLHDFRTDSSTSRVSHDSTVPKQSHNHASTGLDGSNHGSSMLPARTKYIFPDLRDYRGPILAVINHHDAQQLLQLPTLLSRRRIYRNHSVMARRNQCIRKGGEAFCRLGLGNMKVATRRLQRDIFAMELNLLNDVLIHVQKNETLDTSEQRSGSIKAVYRLRVDNYQLLLTSLYHQREAANDALSILGRTPPKLPTLGSSGNVAEWHNENDFEIIGVCFRLEVENFLWELDQALNCRGHPHRQSVVNTKLLQITQGLAPEIALRVGGSDSEIQKGQHFPQRVQQFVSAQTIRLVQHPPVVPALLHFSTIHLAERPAAQPTTSLCMNRKVLTGIPAVRGTDATAISSSGAMDVYRRYSSSLNNPFRFTTGNHSLNEAPPSIATYALEATTPGRFDDVRVYRKPRPAWLDEIQWISCEYDPNSETEVRDRDHSCNTTLISSHISLCELSESSSARGIAARCRYTFQAFTHRLRQSALILNTSSKLVGVKQPASSVA
ncbi:hypothetical protein C8R43DRAFT_1157229, partial [Mycena crocata]